MFLSHYGVIGTSSECCIRIADLKFLSHYGVIGTLLVGVG